MLNRLHVESYGSPSKTMFGGPKDTTWPYANDASEQSDLDGSIGENKGKRRASG